MTQCRLMGSQWCREVDFPSLWIPSLLDLYSTFHYIYSLSNLHINNCSKTLSGALISENLVNCIKQMVEGWFPVCLASPLDCCLPALTDLGPLANHKRSKWVSAMPSTCLGFAAQSTQCCYWPTGLTRWCQAKSSARRHSSFTTTANTAFLTSIFSYLNAGGGRGSDLTFFQPS